MVRKAAGEYGAVHELHVGRYDLSNFEWQVYVKFGVDHNVLEIITGPSRSTALRMALAALEARK